MNGNVFRVVFDAPVKQGELFFLCSEGARFPLGHDAVRAMSPLPDMRVGDRILIDGVRSDMQVVSVVWLPGDAFTPSTKAYMLDGGIGKTGEFECIANRPDGYSLAWITLSDKGAAGKRVDESGPMIQDLVGNTLALKYGQGFIIPDEPDQLRALMVDLALNQRFDFLFTTGGTGVGPRDITPEATLAVIEKRLPGYERAMTGASLAKTPHGAISRAVAGTLGKTLIVNLPGSPKAVAECLEPLLPTLKHTMDKLKGDPADCTNLRK